MKKLKLCAAILSAAMIISFSGCGRAYAKEETQIFAMDTVMLLTAYGENARAGLDAARSVINGLDAGLDPDTGELAELNASGSAQVSADIAEIFSVCKQVCESTQGAFDPAVYPLVKAWGFIDQQYRVPEDSEISAILARKDFASAALTGERVITLPEGTEISFAAIAKGYTSQKAVEAMRDAGVEHAIISLGGNVQTLGETRPDGKKWTVAIQDPNDTGSYAGTLSVGETAVVTSGGYQRFFEENGKKYHHIIDPKTGYPAESGLISVTIVCQNGALADALSTALFVMGEDAASEYYRTAGGFEMVLITSDGRALVSPGLREAYTANGDKYETVYLEDRRNETGKRLLLPRCAGGRA